MGLSVTAMADTIESVPQTSTKDVKVTVKNTISAPVYSVDVTWESLEFTYTFGSSHTWKPQDHVYNDNGESSWSGTNQGNDNTANIVVKNHSDAAVIVNAGFGAEKKTTAEANGVTATLDGDISNKSLESAATAAYGNFDGAAKAEMTVTVTGVPTNTNADAVITVGTLNVTVSHQ